ncbi:PAAR domain-containing protein [Lysobacter sp. yr284]|uniref:PAAR domain-containing protein n=1 Tax=Lysobacter sp. yr284 TaxID=1761791 RepID=UPI0020C8C50F|nr:PAAR domain-containing protein [Lysobacter sp. yr284]
MGDTTTGGGSVVSGSPFTDIDGKPVARIGDSVVCLRHGPTVIVSGDSTMIVDGQPVARHGDGLACTCSLVAVQQAHVHIASGGAGAAASAAAAEAAAAAAPGDEQEAAGHDYDQHFLLVEEAGGEPLKDWPYLIELPSGKKIEGRTDAEGKTRKISSQEAELATLSVLEPEPPSLDANWDDWS